MLLDQNAAWSKEMEGRLYSDPALSHVMRLQRVEAVSPIVAYGGGEDRRRAQQNGRTGA